MPSLTAPYPTLEDVMNLARVRANDAIESIGGQTLMDNQPFTLPLINGAFQKFQQFLVGLGYVTLYDEFILTGVPPAATIDNGVFVSLSWTGYLDGVDALNAAYALPQNLIRPVEIWSRASVNVGTNTANFIKIDPILGGLAAVPKQQWLEQWEWRADAIYSPGAIVATDWRIRYLKYLPDFVAVTVTPFNAQTVPIMRSLSPFAWFVAYEFCQARGDMETMLQNGKEEAMQIVGLDSINGRTVPKESELQKMRDRYTPVAGGPAQ